MTTKTSEIAQFIRNIDADSFVKMPNVSGNPATGAGNLYFDTADNTMKYYDGTNWVGMGGNVNRYNYTATANQTSFTATYTAGNVDVYLNGTKLTRVTDYTDSSGTAIVLTTGADVGDLIDIVAFTAQSVVSGTFNSPVRIDGAGDASLSSTGHPLQIGDTTATNIAFDTNEIMARNNGVGHNLHLNADGGSVTVNNITGDGLYVGTKIEVGEQPNTTSLPTGTLIHLHKSFATAAPVTLDESPSIVLSENETTGAGNQGYHGAYWFGSQDTNTPSAFNWKVAGMASQSDGNDTEGNVSTGNLEFYTTNNTSSATKAAELSKTGSWNVPAQPAFEAVKTTDTIGTANAFNYLRAFDSMSFQTGNTSGTGMNLSTGKYTAPADGLYHFSCTMTWDGGDGGDDSFGIGFVITNNSTYYNFNYTNNDGFRTNPRWETTAGQEMMVTISKTCRLAAGAVIGLYFRDVDHTTINLQHAEFGGFKFA